MLLSTTQMHLSITCFETRFINKFMRGLHALTKFSRVPSRLEKGLKMTVYVTQENPRMDILSAREYGELAPLTSPQEQIHLSPGRVVAHIKRRLQHFNDDDWLLPMGDPAIIGVAFAVAADINNGRINLLKWDKFERTYYPVKIQVRGGIDNLPQPDEDTFNGNN